MIKAKFKTRFNADLDGKLAYAKYGKEENPPYQPVLILGPGNIQQPKQKNHQKWANVYNQVSSTSRSSLPTRIARSPPPFYLPSFRSPLLPFSS